jgi:hypothetical protein
VTQLTQYFKTYKNIKQIAELTSSIMSIQQELKRMIFSDFENGYDDLKGGDGLCINCECPGSTNREI